MEMFHRRKDAFLITGHHLRLYKKLYNVSVGLCNEATAYQGASTTVERLINRKENPYEIFPGNGYVHDVLGKTKKDHEIYQYELSSLFYFFLNLPDDAPVAVRAGGLDALCRLCRGGINTSTGERKGGSHCNQILIKPIATYVDAKVAIELLGWSIGSQALLLTIPMIKIKEKLAN